jgi:hypothetical protein
MGVSVHMENTGVDVSDGRVTKAFENLPALVHAVHICATLEQPLQVMEHARVCKDARWAAAGTWSRGMGKANEKARGDDDLNEHMLDKCSMLPSLFHGGAVQVESS